MPTIVTKFKIFLASPSDLGDDRMAIDEVIDELNLTFGVQNNIYLELVKWETHSAPGISQIDSQDVINKDIGDDYDLFIGLLWKKFGSKTAVSESGTHEEFLIAYRKFQEDPNSIQLLIYFKNTPVSLTDLDPDQILKIRKFKEELGDEKKGLYWHYENTEQLAKFLRIHIPKRILELKGHFDSTTPSKPIKAEIVKVEETIGGHLGIVDYQEIIEENFQEATLALERIGESITWIGEQLTTKTNEINALKLGGTQPSRKDLKDIYKRTSKILDSFSNRIDPDIPIYQENFEKGIDAFSNLLNIGRADFEINQDENEETKQSLRTLVLQIDEGIVAMSEFLDAVKSFPRVSQDLNKSRDNLVSKLEKLLNNMRISRNIAEELLDSI